MMAGLMSETEVLKLLIRSFLKGSLKFSLQIEDIKSLSWLNQEAFLNLTIHSELLKKYPINTDFSQRFIKKLVKYLEPVQDIHDELYSYLCDLMKSAPTDNTFCYHHYVLFNDLSKVITIKETNILVINGTTGMRTWEAGLMLADWALCNQSIFKDQRVLELGSGVGFTGITIAKYCKPHSILMSDCHNDVLKAIHDNIVINFPDYKMEDTLGGSNFKGEHNSIGVMKIDWNVQEDLLCEIIPDVLVGADIVYDPSILPQLCKVISTFFERNVKLEVYIASVIRNEETFNVFLSKLVDMNLKFEKLLLNEPVFIDWDQDTKRCLLKVNY